MTIKYIGSKRLLLPHIESLVRELDGVHTVLDLFSGTTRVARRFKQLGYQVHANDTAAYSEVLARAAIATDARRVDRRGLTAAIDDLNRSVPDPGWFTANFCEHARYLHPDNGARVDTIRERIEVGSPDEPMRSLLLSALLLAADRVDSTTGVQMAYLKRWAPRALKPLQLKLPDLFDGTGTVSRLDAADCARQVGPVDLAYIDPPYNQHSYLGNYHVWETLILNDRPELYGIARKRIDCKTRKSPWNSRRQIRDAFATLLDALQARYLLVSFSDEGYLSTAELHALLEPLGEVQRHDIAHPRYVGARIGIYNPAGKKVGRVGHLHNTECLYLVRCTRRKADRAS